MRRSLFLSYYFPPIGGAGAQRPAKFVRYLSALGGSPAVVTGPGMHTGRWTPLDASLLDAIPASVEVRRASGEPGAASLWHGRAERWLGTESAWKRWWVGESVAQGVAVDEIDAIYAIMSPYWSADAAVELSRDIGRPWIADIGDPWALDEMVVYPTAWHRRRELQRMRRLLGTAAAIVMTTPEAARRIRQEFPELADRPIISIPCGFDPSDFAEPEPVRSDQTFRIVHTGYLHTELGYQQRQAVRARRLMGGGVKGVDILTRSHVYLLEAVGRLIARDPSLRSTIEIHLAGVLSGSDRREAERSSVVRTLGYLSHADSIELMRSADLLFLPMQNLPPGVRSATVPGKTYEYLASQRPILAAVPEGDARDILLQAGTAHVCAPADVEGMAEIIAAELSRTAPPSSVNLDLVQRFDYARLSERVAEVIEQVVDRKPSRLSALSSTGEAPAFKIEGPEVLDPRRVSTRRPTVEGRRVLLLAYYFPPIGGAGAQSSVKLARYLPELGFSVTVVTGSGAARDRWSPVDDSLIRELPKEVDVHWLPGPEPPPKGLWRRRAERWLGLQTDWSRWWIEGMVAKGMEIQDDFDVIIASMSPYDSAAAAAILAHKVAKPWIAGLRDPWALDEMVVYPTAWHRRRELQRMRRLLGTAAAIVMTTPEAARRIRQEFPELADRPIISISNGFDPSDFAEPEPVRSDQTFRIVHTGYLHTELGYQQRQAVRARRLMGGGVKGVDILTRSHVYLLEAVERLIARDPSLRSTIEIHLAGVLSGSDRREAERSSVVRTLGYLSHADSIELMRSADLLFLPMQNLPPGVRSATVPGKTYEYLASQRPILAAVPEGDARDILLQAGTAHVCAPADVEGMAAVIEAELKRWSAGLAVRQPGRELLARFERRNLTAAYPALIESVLNGGRAVTKTSRARFAA